MAYRIMRISIHFTDYTIKSLENAQGENATASIFNTLLSLTSGTVRRAGAASSPTRVCCRCYNWLLHLYLLSRAYLISNLQSMLFHKSTILTTIPKIGTLFEHSRA
jgi:hypothetical protein